MYGDFFFSSVRVKKYFGAYPPVKCIIVIKIITYDFFWFLNIHKININL